MEITPIRRLQLPLLETVAVRQDDGVVRVKRNASLIDEDAAGKKILRDN
jgi:hypothetical protein